MIRLIENQFDCRHPVLVHEDSRPSSFVNNTLGFREGEVNRQDRIVEASQPWYDAIGEGSVEADFPTLLARRTYRLAETGAWPDKWRTVAPQRRVIRIRT